MCQQVKHHIITNEDIKTMVEDTFNDFRLCETTFDEFFSELLVPNSPSLFMAINVGEKLQYMGLAVTHVWS